MKTLIWKDWREHRAKLLIGLGLMVLLQLLRTKRYFDLVLVEGMLRGLYSVGGVIVSILLAVDLVSSERKAGTLNFTLTTPVSVLRFLTSKFVLGSMALLALHVVYWGIIYNVGNAVGSLPQYDGEARVAKHILEMVPFSKMLIASFPVFWLAFTITFAWSCASDDASVATAGGLMTFGLLVIIISVLGYTTVVSELWGLHGHILRIASGGDYLVPRTLVLLLLTGLTFVCSVLYLARFREHKAGWKLIGVFAALLISGGLLNSKVEKAAYWETGEVVFNVERAIRGLELVDNTAFLVVKNGLASVDISTVKEPRTLDILELNEWLPSQVTVHGGRAYVVAEDEDGIKGDWDDLHILQIDISDPTALKLETHTKVAEADQYQWRGPPKAGKGALYFGLVSNEGLEVVVIDVSGDAPIAAERVMIKEIPIAEETKNNSLSRRYEQAYLTIHDDVAYVGTTDGITVLDLSDPIHPRIARKIDLNDEDGLIYGPRRMATGNGKLFTARNLPVEYLVFDIADPLNPVEISHDLILHGPRKMEWSDGHLITMPHRNRIEVHEVSESGKIAKIKEVRIEDKNLWENQGGLFPARDGYFITPMGTNLVIHPIRKVRGDA